jgi:superfamily II RNA helicase
MSTATPPGTASDAGASDASAATASLAALLPKPGEPAPSADDILSRFVSWAAQKGLQLYSAQEEALLELVTGKHVILSTPTGSGKSLVATAQIFRTVCLGGRAFYTCPIKALVNEKFFQLCDAFGAERVGMVTGDATINRDAPIICCTAEILANLVLRDPTAPVDSVVMDEFHYYGDRERGVAWQLPLLTQEYTTFLLMSATLGDTTLIEKSLEERTGKEVALIRGMLRPVPLDYSYVETPLHETVADLIERGRSPIYLVNFTQRAAAEQAQNLMSVNFSTKEEKAALAAALEGFKFDSPYGKELQRFLRHGVGLHHAGLLPKYRLLVERLAQQGMLKVVSGTDTLGVGVNIPLRTVLFTQLCKYGGDKVSVLSSRDFHQVAGRAGRKGFDTQGYVVAQAPEYVIENIRLAQKAAGGKKVVKQKPPTKGYAHWDKSTFERLIGSMPEPLESRFTVTFGMLLDLLKAAEGSSENGYKRLVGIIRRSHGREWDRRQHLKRAAQSLRTLRGAGLVELVKGRPATLRISTALGEDFSLNHALTLYLLEALQALDKTQESYPLDVVSLVESILENPDVVLYAQKSHAKDLKMAEMKAAGMEYEERMAELEKVEYPKPLAEFIYPTFNLFSAKHPWVGQDNIRPKSIAREMFERFCTFADYVRDYGLQRSEGVLLRYLSDAYKTLLQGVPEEAKTDELEDLIMHLRGVVRGVDSSLVDEWERLRDPAGAARKAAAAAAVEALPKALWEDPKRLGARVRAELHALVKFLADRRWEEAAAAVHDPEAKWTPSAVEEELKAYFAEHPGIDTTPRSRRPQHTRMVEEGPRRYRVQHKLLDPEGDEDWMVEALVDLSEPGSEERPLLQLVRVGT